MTPNLGKKLLPGDILLYKDDSSVPSLLRGKWRKVEQPIDERGFIQVECLTTTDGGRALPDYFHNFFIRNGVIYK